MNKRMKLQDHSGFTIIELLIATTIFTLVLILLTTGTLAVSRLYEKGIISAQTQTATRNILNDVTQQLQFNAVPFAALAPKVCPATNPAVECGFCIGSNEFSYIFNQAVVDQTATTPAVHALLERNTGNSNGGCTAAGLDPINNPTNPPSGAASTELLSARMRLNNLDVVPVTGNSSLYCVSIRVIYGDSNLLTPASPQTDSCGKQYLQQQCSGQYSSLIGGQFCAVSGLDTYIQERVQLP